MLNTRKIELENGGILEVFEIMNEAGAETGDLIFDMNETKFHPVYRLGSTNICFDAKFQANIHKIVGSSRPKDDLPFKKRVISKKLFLNKDLYSEIENLIITWSIDGTKTAGTLTRQIMKLLNKDNEK
jgi:hypothetical protein